MKHFTPTPSNRNARAFLASLLAYLLVVGQFAPVALANSPATRAATAAAASGAGVGEARRLDAAPEPAPLPAAVAGVTATKIDSFTDPEMDGKAEPGQEIGYEVTVTNNGPDTSSLTFTDTIDPNTTLVTGSVTMSPLARNDAYTGSTSAPLVVNAATGVLANDSGVPDPWAVAATGQATTKGGSVDIAADGSFTYTPPAGSFTGADTFTYTAANANLPDDTATVTIAFNPSAVNDAPTVNEDSGATTIDVLANDTDPDGGTNTIQSVTQPTNGAVVITNGGADLTYQPNANYCNTDTGVPDTFDYTLNGGSIGTVSVNVTCVDDPPVANDDSATVNEDSSNNAIDVLANDSDAENDAITITSASDPPKGTVTLTGGSPGAHTGLTYTPDADYCNSQMGGTPDTFTYTVNGGDTATVSVTITCIEDDPTAVNDSATVPEDSGATPINVLANDTDPDGGTNTIQSVTQPTNGAVVITNGGADLTYQPNANYCNTDTGVPDTFDYTLNGGSIGTVSVNVTCEDDAPTAVDDTATVAEDSGATAVLVLTNDSDIDGGPMSIVSVTQGTNGAVVITGGGTGLTYQPNADFNGADSFTYTLNGGSIGNVSVTVTEVNDAPTANNDSLTAVLEDSGTRSIAFADLTGNDSKGPDNESSQSLTITNVGSAVGGSVQTNGTNVEFTPTANFCGAASFTYTVSDDGTTNGMPDAKTSTATASFTITCVNDEPSFTKGADQTVNEDAPAQTVNGWATAITAGPGEDATQTVTFVVTNDNNSLFSVQPAVSSTGVLTYTLAADQNGSATVTIKITDNGGTDNGGDDESPTQTFTITVNPVNDPPVVTNKNYNAQANMLVSIPAGSGLLTGVTDADSGVNGCVPTPFTVASVSATSPAGGNVTFNASTGAFDFNPPPGVTGNVTFTYTVSDNGCPGSATSAPATVTFSVAGPVIWFVNSAAATNGDGRLTTPFRFLDGQPGAADDADDVDAANHHIFLYSGGTYTGGLTLNANETLTGQSTNRAASFDLLYGITPPSGTAARPTLGGTKPVINSSSRGVGLVADNLLDSLDFVGTTGAAVESTAAVGTLTMRDIVINNSSSAGAGISLTHGGTATLTGANNTVHTRSARAVSVSNTNIGAGNLNFKSISAGNNDASADPDHGILLNNTGTTAGTHGGLIVAGDGNTSQGGNSSGGTIRSTTSHGVSLTSTRGPSFNNVSILNTGGSGVDGTTTVNFTLTNSTLTGNGVFAVTNSSNVGFNDTAGGNETNLTGVVTITNNVLHTAAYHGVDIFSHNGTISDANISNNSIVSGTTTSTGGTSFGSGIRLIAFGNASTAAHVTKATINNNNIQNFPGGAGILAQGGNSNSTSAPVTTMGQAGHATNIVAITNNLIKGNSPSNRISTHAIQASVNGRGQGNFNISGNGTVANPITNVTGNVISHSSLGLANVTSTISNNVVVANHTAGVGGALGISVGVGRTFAVSDTATLTTSITGNTVSQTDANGILARAVEGQSTMNITVKNNSVAAPLAGVRPGISVHSGTSEAGTDAAVCLDITGNTSAGSGGALGIGIRKEGTNATVNDYGIEGLSPNPATGTQAAAYVASNNSGGAFNQSGANDSVAVFVSCGSAPNAAMAVSSMAEESVSAASEDGSQMSQLTLSTEQARALADAEPVPPPDRPVVEQVPAALAPARTWSDMPIIILPKDDEKKDEEKDGEKDEPAAEDGAAKSDGQARVRNVSHVGPLGAAPSSAPRFVRASYTEERAPAVTATRAATTKPAPKAAKARTRTAPLAAVAGETVNVTIGTMPTGKTVKIRFSVTVASPFTDPSEQVSNQGTVTDGASINVLTDDPHTGTADDATVTPIAAPPEIYARDARGSEPGELLFTVVLSKPAAATVTVDYATADGTATVAGGDYTAAGGTLTFMAGEQIKTVAVTILSNSPSNEPDETVLLNLSNASGAAIADSQATGTISEDAAPGQILISELRTSGPGGAGDDFVEVYNNSDTPHTVAASDVSAGYGLFKKGSDCNAAPVLVGVIPNGTVIPARGHYLFVGSQYSLGNYGGTGAAAGDLTLSSDLESDANVGIFTTSNVVGLSSAARLDAVGFGTNAGNNCSLLREGANLGPAAGSALEHTYFRKLCDFVQGVGCQTPGTPKDTGDNSSDFMFADTEGTNVPGTGRRLGAPGPENSSSPRKNDLLPLLLLDSSAAAASPPNRVRNNFSAGDDASTSSFGTLAIRRRVVNNTGAPVTRLRFRISEITGFPAGAGMADMRAITSMDVSNVTITNDSGTCNGPASCMVTVKGTTLEQPPAQPIGGGLNATLTVTLGAPLANGSSVNVQFMLGAQNPGLFRFLVITEALQQ